MGIALVVVSRVALNRAMINLHQRIEPYRLAVIRVKLNPSA